MIDLLTLGVAILACYRVAQLVTIDDGPGDVFLRLRIWAGCYDLNETGRVRTNLGRGLVCPYCVGVWVALVLALALRGISADMPLVWLAIAGGQAALEGRK